jgi:hypothetical protein
MHINIFVTFFLADNLSLELRFRFIDGFFRLSVGWNMCCCIYFVMFDHMYLISFFFSDIHVLVIKVITLTEYLQLQPMTVPEL